MNSKLVKILESSETDSSDESTGNSINKDIVLKWNKEGTYVGISKEDDGKLYMGVYTSDGSTEQRPYGFIDKDKLKKFAQDILAITGE